MPDGANNFYKSDKVTMQKVSFKNQFQMNVAGNLFIPRNLNQDKDRRADGCGDSHRRHVRKPCCASEVL